MLDEVSGPDGPVGVASDGWEPGGGRGDVTGSVAGLGPDGVELLAAAVEEVRAGVEAGYKAIEQVPRRAPSLARGPGRQAARLTTPARLGHDWVGGARAGPPVTSPGPAALIHRPAHGRAGPRRIRDKTGSRARDRLAGSAPDPGRRRATRRLQGLAESRRARGRNGTREAIEYRNAIETLCLESGTPRGASTGRRVGLARTCSNIEVRKESGSAARQPGY